VAYELSLPNHSKLHIDFHVSCLKKVIEIKFLTQTSLPELDEEGSIWLHPQAGLEHQETLSLSTHNQGNFSSVEYTTKGFHMGLIAIL
jgi:hypothetical protein